MKCVLATRALTEQLALPPQIRQAQDAGVNVYGAGTEFGRPLVNSALTLAIVTGMSVSDVSQKTVANLGWDKVRLTAPVFAGDTIYAESEVIGKRESASRPHHGIVTVRTTGKKADGTVFMTFERSALIPMRGHAVDDRLDY